MATVELRPNIYPKPRTRPKGRSASFEDVFGVRSMREPFNRVAVNYMLQRADRLDLSTKQQDSLTAILKKAGNEDYLVTSYNKGEKGYDDPGTGQFIPNCDRWIVSGAGLQKLEKKMRATICKDTWIDLDFVNCGPTLLLELCQKQNLPEDHYQCLQEYVKNREQRLQDGIPFVTRDELKKVVIQMMHGKQLSFIRAEFNTGDDALDGIEWLAPLEKELRMICPAIACCDEFEEIWARRKKESNRDTKILAQILFVCENRCLEALYNYLQMQGVIRDGECVLTFDGIMVPASDRNNQRIGAGFLRQASKAIHEQTGFTLEVKKKPFTEGYELPDGFQSTVHECYFQIQAGDDQAAADIIVDRLKGRLVKSGGRYFVRDDHSVIFKEDEQEVRDAIINMTQTDLEIVVCGGDGHVHPYSKNTTKMKACIPRILADKSIIDDKFITKLWDGNLGYIAYTDGVYSFGDRKMLTFDEAIEREIFFVKDTQRPFPCLQQSTPTTVLPQVHAHLGQSVGFDKQTGKLIRGAKVVAPQHAIRESEIGIRSVENIQNAQNAQNAGNGVNARDNTRDSNVHESAQDSVIGELIRRVIEPLFPDADARYHFFNCMARGMAGDIHDKRWYMLQGPRNCGKSTLYKLFKLAFGPFVHMFGAENVLQRQNAQDAAKAQSWMKPLEFARIAFSNELKHTGMQPKFDGELLKRMCSNGDTIELRTNYKDEIQIRLQTTFVLAFNNGCEVEPPDAYQTMTGFKFQNEFHDPHEMGGESWKKNYLPKDPALDAFIKRPDVVDAFTMFVFSHYTHDKQAPPAIVIEYTNSLKGDAVEPMEVRFGNIVRKSEDSKDVVFYKEIRMELARAGMGLVSYTKIDDYVHTLYGLKPNKPSKHIDGKLVQDRGFRGLRLQAHGFDETAARIRKNESVKKMVRCETIDNFTSDNRIGSGTG